LTFETYFSNKFKTPQNRHFLFPIFEINCRFPCSYQFNFVSLQTKIIDMIEVYTDGGCRHNPGLGAWAFVVIEKGKIIYQKSGTKLYTTNNEMELTAIMEALEYIQPSITPSPFDEAIVCSDSQYAINVLREWYFKWESNGELQGKKNIPIIQRIIYLCTINHYSISFQWLRGHSTNPFNNLADRLVNEAMDSYLNSATSQPPSL